MTNDGAQNDERPGGRLGRERGQRALDLEDGCQTRASHELAADGE